MSSRERYKDAGQKKVCTLRLAWELLLAQCRCPHVVIL